MDTIRVSHNLDQYNVVSQLDSRVAKNVKFRSKVIYQELVISKLCETKKKIKAIFNSFKCTLTMEHPLMIGIANVLCSDMQASDQKTSSQQLNVSDLIMSL